MLRIGQVEATATQDGKYTDGSVAGGIAATRLRAAAFNAMQEELAHIVESAGLALDINDMTQVLKAIQKLTLSRANPFADIKSDGAAAISTALTNLGLGEGSALPVGVPVPWPSATPPTGWMKCNGSSFNLSSYPALAAVFPSGVLPDLRGEFIRGWDDGRLVDTDRAVMSSQSARVGYIKFDLGVYGIPTGTGTLILANDILITGQDINGSSLLLNNSNERAIGDMYVVPTDTRPRNIAFNYIVRAA
ncbi:phage tail protein [Escherichia coli]|uniref:phage tail protein n=1 Tax=Escherichia coli TaxID=562 RepID=UPI0032DB0E21